jgi:Phage Tail Collar Domain
MSRSIRVHEPTNRSVVRRALGLGALASLFAVCSRGLAHAADALTISANGEVAVDKLRVQNSLSVAGRVQVGEVLHVPGGTNPTVASQGAYLGWNASGGVGETDFINNRGLGSGGFSFANTPPSGTPRTTLMFISGAGNVDVAGTVKAASLETNSGISLAAVQNALVPIGTIIAYGGDIGNAGVVSALRSQGWLPCDGGAYSTQDYPELAKVIGNAFGTLRVPDLRGRFLRGTDQGTKRDPDSASRRAENGGNAGDKVGSVQDDQFMKHTHSYDHFPAARGGIASGDHWRNGDAQTGEAGGNETRPKNVNVNWIIRAK